MDQLEDANILQLMIKNVSRDVKLSDEEIIILRDFKKQLSNDEWKEWLQYARDEKKRMKSEQLLEDEVIKESKNENNYITGSNQNSETDNVNGFSNGINAKYQPVNFQTLSPILSYNHGDSSTSSNFSNNIAFNGKSIPLLPPTPPLPVSLELPPRRPIHPDKVTHSSTQEDNKLHGDALSDLYPSKSLSEQYLPSNNPSNLNLNPNSSQINRNNSLLNSSFDSKEQSDDASGVSLSKMKIPHHSSSRPSSRLPSPAAYDIKQHRFENKSGFLNEKRHPSPSYNFSRESRSLHYKLPSSSSISKQLDFAKKDANIQSVEPLHYIPSNPSTTGQDINRTTPLSSAFPTQSNTKLSQEFTPNTYSVKSLNRVYDPPSKPFERTLQLNPPKSPPNEVLDVLQSSATRIDSAYTSALQLLKSIQKSPPSDKINSIGYNSYNAFNRPMKSENENVIPLLEEMIKSMRKSKEALSSIVDGNYSQHPSTVKASQHQPEVGKLDDPSTPEPSYQETFHPMNDPIESNDSWSPGRRMSPYVDSDVLNALKDSTGLLSIGVDDFHDYEPSKRELEEVDELADGTIHHPNQMNHHSNRHQLKEQPMRASTEDWRSLSTSLYGDLNHFNRIANPNKVMTNHNEFEVTSQFKTMKNDSQVQAPSPYFGQFHHYNSSSYTWEGVKYTRGQGKVSKICVAQGPLVMAFDEFPIRFDLESASVDVVWREGRSTSYIKGSNASPDSILSTSNDANGKYVMNKYGEKVFLNSSAIRRKLAAKEGNVPNTAAHSSTLRRERFNFDDIFMGPSALGRLSAYVHQRTRKALETSSNACFLCLACGDPAQGDMEPTVSLMIGNGGGTGIISQVLDEVLLFVRPSSSSASTATSNPAVLSNLHSVGNNSKATSNTKAQAAYLSTKLAHEHSTSKILLSALLFQNNTDGKLKEEMIDLFSNNTTANRQPNANRRPSIKKKSSDGSIMLCDVTKINLRNAADFERIAGMLIGKKAAVNEVISMLESFNDTVIDEVAEIVSSLAVWNTFIRNESLTSMPSMNSSRTYEGNPEEEQDFKAKPSVSRGSSSSLTMLMILSVVGGGVHKLKNSINFYFVCPCGNLWDEPGMDINLVAESMSVLSSRNASNIPDYVKQFSPLTMLLSDPQILPMDYIAMVVIHRQQDTKVNKKNNVSPVKLFERNDEKLVKSALNSLRVLSQDGHISK